MGARPNSQRGQCARLGQVLGFAAQVLVATTLAGTPAVATDFGGGKGSRDRETLVIALGAVIGDRCGFSTPPAKTVDGLHIDRAGSTDIPFTLDCNTPFVIGLSSRSGGFSHTGIHNDSGFAFAKPYEASLTVDTDRGTLAPLACKSADLKPTSTVACDIRAVQAGDGLHSGRAVAIQKPGKIRVRWDDRGDSPRLAAGVYQDTITLYVAARS